MTTDQKIEAVLGLAQENKARMDEMFRLLIEERQLNNDRFTQLASGLSDVTREVSGMKVEMARMNSNLNAKIDKVYESLSQDILAFGDDLHQVKRRVTRLEKKLLS